MNECEMLGGYWNLSCESLVVDEYACKIFWFSSLRMAAEQTGASPEEAFSKALEKAKLMSAEIL